MFLGDSVLTRRVLPETNVLSRMTGHAMWQTFSNLSADSDKITALAEKSKKEKDSRKHKNEVGAEYYISTIGPANKDPLSVPMKVV